MYLETLLKLFLAFILGGIVGYEREHKNRPAGLRTHVLVAIGSTLVQIISLDYVNLKNASIDPFRLGSQVISGIGFLGAGTILKEGVNVKGLTTAASLWTVACIGLAVGCGLYFEAFITTLFVFLSLRGLKVIEQRISKEDRYYNLQILAENVPGVIGNIGKELEKLNINIIGIEISGGEDDEAVVFLNLKTPNYICINKIVEVLVKIKNIKEVKVI
ncbi:putative Mg2+ transporter-C (MgtC) family protein [Caloramator fervidus]|uniref:Putative Mg2+ transporter-C (MgtC) family protein n=1 Tax=Caloramator fervidus TaxID=29344 RepID=A0A1H5T0V3_9CLOT|nr:MgtC/SapB family protein [Caloramator fervidus]SEF56420.1 putative Mg2+ transporter-C (MgtC) family protein [Caloramator fervidus]